MVAFRRGTEDLIRRAARRSECGWHELVGRVESRLRVLCRMRMSARARGRFDPDDLCQEVFVEALRRIDTFEYRGPGSLQRWLAAVLRNKLMHAERSAARLAHPRTDIGEPPALAGGELPQGLRLALHEVPASASTDTRRRDMEERVHAMLMQLAPAEREVLLLKHFEGLSGREAAARLGVDESTVSGRYRRALERCARKLRDADGR